jgi:hypothetical protein
MITQTKMELVSERPVMSVSSEWTRREAREAGDGDASSAYADDKTKSKKQLLQELVDLRQRVRALEVTDKHRAPVEIEPPGTALGLRELLAASPANHLHDASFGRVPVHFR